MTEKSIALGTFDGFHLGHTAVLSAACESRYKPYVLLFKQHPMAVITGTAPAELLTVGVRQKLANEVGITPLVTDFNEICNLSPEEFFSSILIEKHNAKHLACGENYTFGKNGKGNVDTLNKLCSETGTELTVVPTQMFENEIISSTKIRNEIENGNMVKANKMLGRAFSYDFEVVSGDKRGRLLGFPTINQFFPGGFVKMKFGVYASAVFVDGAYHPAVTNFGVRPTIGTNSMRSETCILGYSGNLYSQNVEVQMLEYLRAEKKFPDLEQLTAQMEKDAAQSKEIFNNSLALLH